MNNTTYRKILSPIQPQIKPTRGAIDVRSEKHPVHDEVRKLCGTPYNIEISFQEDTDTLNHFKHIPGLIAILCTLKKNGQVQAFGRSCACFSQWNKYPARTIATAISGSFLSATNNFTKVFEALRTSQEEGQIIQKFGEIHSPFQYQESEPASDKQKSYLLQLINSKVEDENERNQLLSKIDELDKDTASEMIGSLLNNDNNDINY